ncbi:MAG: class I SAM-dependent methyltransferase [Gemmatimonadales bacterium]
MRSPWCRRIPRAVAFAAALGWCNPSVAAPQNDAADARRLIDVLGLEAGSVVADVGAGSGVLTVPIARHVGPQGRVYGTDINPDRLADIREAVRAASLENVVVVEGAPGETMLPAQCCDAIFMRNVYHHFGDPEAMNASLLRSLQPGGRLAVVDFPPDQARSAAPGSRAQGDAHGVTSATVIEELSAAGFTRVRRLEWTNSRAFLVVAERPRPER